jgi:hypothetical protein
MASCWAPVLRGRRSHTYCILHIRACAAKCQQPRANQYATCGGATCLRRVWNGDPEHDGHDEVQLRRLWPRLLILLNPEPQVLCLLPKCRAVHVMHLEQVRLLGSRVQSEFRHAPAVFKAATEGLAHPDTCCPGRNSALSLCCVHNLLVGSRTQPGSASSQPIGQITTAISTAYWGRMKRPSPHLHRPRLAARPEGVTVTVVCGQLEKPWHRRRLRTRLDID